MNLSQETLTDENGLLDAFMGFLVCLEQMDNLFCLVMAVNLVMVECFLILLCIMGNLSSGILFVWTLSYCVDNDLFINMIVVECQAPHSYY